MIEVSPQTALRDIAAALAARKVPFALVGGLAVSIRGEVRFTRDVDVAVALSEPELERLVRDLRAAGYAIAALVEHETAGRTATVRLVTRGGINVDLICASSGIEQEIIADATEVDVRGAGLLRVASAEDLLAMKVLSFTDRRRRDFDDAVQLVLANSHLDLDRVRGRLALVHERGFDRGEDLVAKLNSVLAAAAAE